jgi:phage terminase small subunit
MTKALTLKQENFCLAYIETGNASEAYRRAFNTERMKPETVNNKAYAMLKVGEIRARLDAYKKPVIEKTQLRLERVILENMNVAFFDIRTILDNDGAVKPVNEWPPEAGAAISSIEVLEQYEGSGKDRVFVGYLKKVRLVEKGGALDRLMKHLGAYEKDNKQKENNPMFLFMQQLMGTALPVASNPHLIDVTDSDD